MSFGNFLKTIDRPLFRNYQLEKYQENNVVEKQADPEDFFRSVPTFEKKTVTKIDLPSIENLPETHVARVFIKARQIPKSFWNELYYASDFHDFVSEILPDHENTLHKNDPRIVIPFFDEEGELLGFQGRSLMSNSKIRYITLKMSEDSRKIFGLNRLDKNRPVHVVEGPFDSMFLDNAVATMDAALYNIIPNLGALNYIFVYDNEPRNSSVCSHMKKTIEQGEKICIWPKYIEQKDINDMILAGLPVQKIINDHTYSTHRAMLEFTAWKKCT